MKLFKLLTGRSFIQGNCLMAGITTCSIAQDSSGLSFGGSGWMQYNVIGSSSVNNNRYDGKSLLSTGAQISLSDRISEKLRITSGFGIVTGNTLPQSPTSNTGYSLPTTDPYVSEADFTYMFQNTPDSKTWIRGGLFPYTYNPDVKDLGLYLLRGPVHPGLLVSGVETQGILPIGNQAGLPVANIMGLQFHHQWKNFQGDFLLASETRYYPFFDLSPAYIASYQVHSSLRLGAGVNFYHLIPIDSKLTNRNFDALNSSNDISYAGTKLMASAVFDPKPLMKSGSPFGPEDLRLYAEIGFIGLENDSVYRQIYGSYFHRMPVMVGLNLPAFNYLNHLSLEVEWYGAGFNDDMSSFNRQYYSPYPVGWTPSGNVYTRRDNWKWSVHASRMIQNHVMLTVQVADDHYRPGIYVGYGDSAPPLQQAILITPKDWYASTKLSYFF